MKPVSYTHLVDLYGKYKCKLSLDILKKNKDKQGKLILVTAINPTPAGEGKSTVTVGLGQALCKFCLLYTSRCV